MLQFIGPLFHELHGARSTRAEDVDQQCEQQAEKGTTEKEQRGAALTESASGNGSREDFDMPTVVKVHRCRECVPRVTSGHEGFARPTSFVAKGDRRVGVTQQGRGQERLRQKFVAGESNEVCATGSGGVRVAAVAIERRTHGQGGRTAQTVGGVGGLSGSGRLEKLWSQ